MLEVEWWEYEDAAELATAVAGDARFLIESALDARGDATIALPAAASSLPALDALKDGRLKWKHVTIVPTDDRLVSVEDPSSAARLLAERFLPLGARVVPLTSGGLAVADAGAAADARLQALHWPLDLVWLQVDANGVVASIFPGADFEQALTSGSRAVGVTPAAAPVARVTLTRSAILAARAILLSATGAATRAVVEAALADPAATAHPVGRVLAGAEQAIDIHWCP